MSRRTKSEATSKVLPKVERKDQYFGVVKNPRILKPEMREEFDPSNESHIRALRYFLENGSWEKAGAYLDIEGTHNLPYSCLLAYFYHNTKNI